MLPNLQPGEMMVVLVVAVLLFGKRLPEVGRSLGKGIIEFKKGLRGVDDDFLSPSETSNDHDRPRYATDEAAAVSVPKFELPSSAPTPQPQFETPTTSGQPS